MNRYRASTRRRGRVPLSIVAVVVLLFSLTTTFYISNISFQKIEMNRIDRLQKMDRYLADTKTEFTTQAFYIANTNVESGAQDLKDIPEINEDIQKDFESYINSIYKPYTPAGLEGMKFEVKDKPILYLRWLEKDTKDVTETQALDVSGEIKDTKVYSHLEIVGQVNLTVTDVLTGIVTERIIKIEEPFDSPYLLALNAIESMRNSVQGDSSDVGRLVRYMLFSLMEIRSLNAINESAKLVSDDEIRIAVNLALFLEQVRLFRNYDHIAAKTVVYNGKNLDDLLKTYLGGGSVDPADLFIKFLDIKEFNVTIVSGGISSSSGGSGSSGGSSSGAGKKVFLNPSDQYHNVGPTGYVEAVGAKDMADRTKAKLDALGFDVIVDQDFDTAPYHANSWGADVFLSIHTNAAGPTAKGTVTIYPSTATGERLEKSKQFAKMVNDELVAELNTYDWGIWSDMEIRGITFHVLRNTNMPAALTEVAFHSNLEEEALLKTESFRDRAATAMARAICEYFGVDSSSLGSTSGITITVTPISYTNYTVKIDEIVPNDDVSFIDYLVSKIKNADKNLTKLADNITYQAELFNFEYKMNHMYETPFEFWNNEKESWARALRMRWENFTKVESSLLVPQIERSGTSFLIKGGSGTASGEGSTGGSGGTGSYDGYKALDYAWQYGGEGKNCHCGFNYNIDGGDCAHFVSHCLEAGGLEPYTAHGHRKGAMASNGDPKFASNGIHIGATALCQWLVSSGLGEFVDSLDDLCVGDVIEISGYSHVILYTGKNAAGQHTYAAHNNNHEPGTVLTSGCDMMVHIKSNTAGKELRDPSGNPVGNNNEQTIGGPALYLNTLNISLEGSFRLAGTAQSTVKDGVVLSEKTKVDTASSNNIEFKMKLSFPLYCPFSLDIAEPKPLNPGLVVNLPGGSGSSGSGGSGGVPQSGVKIKVLGYGEMDIEEYLRGVVPSESYPSWEMEALKAQAMAARSYAYYQIQHPKHGEYHVCTTTCCQVYNPSNIHPRTDEAISATSGQYVMKDGKVCHTFFSAACGGHTMNSEDVWGGYVDYLRGVPCPCGKPKNGHGVGYCQWGGQAMALQGKKYDEIIKHYYTGVYIGKLDGTVISGPDSGSSGGLTVAEHPVIEAVENTTFFSNVSLPITGKIIDIIMKSQNIFGKIGNSYVQSLYTKVPVEVLYRLLDIPSLTNVVSTLEMNAVMDKMWSAYDEKKQEDPTIVNHTLYGLLNKLKFNGGDKTLIMEVEQNSYQFTLKFRKNPDETWGYNYTYTAKIKADFRDFSLDIEIDPFRLEFNNIVHYKIKHTHSGKAWETEIILPLFKTPMQTYSLTLNELYFPGSLRTLNVTFGLVPIGGSIGEFSAMISDCHDKIESMAPNISHETVTYIMSEIVRKTMTDLSAQVNALKQIRFFIEYARASDSKRLGNLTFAINITPNYNKHAEWLLQNIDNFVYHLEDSNTKAMFWQVPEDMRNDFKIIREKYLPSVNVLSTISVGWLWDEENIDSLGSGQGMYPDIIDAVIASGYTAGTNLNQEKYELVDIDNVPQDAFNKYHILLITGHKPITFSESLKNTLKKFVEDGGLLWIDNDRDYDIYNFFAPFDLSPDNSNHVKHWGDCWDTKKGEDANKYPLLDGPNCPYPLTSEEIKDLGKVNSLWPNDYYWYWCSPYLVSAPGYDVILKNDVKVWDGPNDDGGDDKPVIVVKAIGKGHVLITANNMFDPIAPPASIRDDVPMRYTIAAEKFFGNVLAWHKAYYSEVVLSSQPSLAVQLDIEGYETLHGASWGGWNTECYVYLSNVPSTQISSLVPGATNVNSDVYLFYMVSRET